MLEEFYLYSELGEGIMKLVREVTITLLGIEQKTRKLFVCRLLWSCLQTPVPCIPSSALTEIQKL